MHKRTIECTYTDLYSMCNNFGDTASNGSQFRLEDYVITADVKFALDLCWTFARFWFATTRVAVVAGDVAVAAVDAAVAAAVVELVDDDFVPLVVDSSNVWLSEFLYPLRNEIKERTIAN